MRLCLACKHLGIVLPFEINSARQARKRRDEKKEYGDTYTFTNSKKHGCKHEYTPGTVMICGKCDGCSPSTEDSERKI